MPLLDGIRDPRDVRALAPEQLPALAAEIRSFLVEKVSATGGHLGPNLGVVELTIALHRVFQSPDDMIIWDTGHQAYVHKILTGRAPGFDQLRQRDGLSGYPSRTESVHDLVENSHASTALSYADGLAKAWEQRGLLGQHHVVAVIGDGALTGGMAWEALNNIADSDRPLVIVVNDNARSYSPTIGGLAHHLSTLRTTHGYERFMNWGKKVLHRTPVVGEPIYGALHGMKKGVKDVVAPQGLFEDLGLKYIGPVDGHDEAEMEFALNRAKAFNGPVIVHAITHKGHGYAPAEKDEADRFHGVGIIDPDTGKPVSAGGPSWTGAFADELVRIGEDRPDVVAITAAMLGPTGLDRFAERFPDRTYDVGIAEQHATTSAAGMAYGGLHPVVALYATFLNRAFDQVLMDCALHQRGRDLRARPRRHHRRRRRQPQRHVGHVDAADRAGPAHRRAARRGHPARGPARGRRRLRRPDRRPLPEGRPRARRSARCASRTATTSLPSRAHPTWSSCPSGPSRRCASTSRSGSRPRGSASSSSIRGGSSRCPPASPGSPRRPGSW